VDHDALLNGCGQGVKELIVLHLGKPVLGPEVLEMLVNLSVKAFGYGLVFSKASQQHQPVV